MSHASKALSTYIQQVETKYNVYNSLIMNLPYEHIYNIGMLIPLLHQDARKGLNEGKSPLEILDHFFEQHTDIKSEKEKIDFFFKVIQYVERQVVLFDSAEDAGFAKVQTAKPGIDLREALHAIDSPLQKQAVLEKLSNFSVRLVFTAHPTQFYPLSVLDIIADLRRSLQKDNLEAIDLNLQQLGLTSFINSEKPTPVEEANNIIYYLRYVYYDAIGDLYHQIKQQLGDKFDNPDLIRIGFWPGGDRDGNPFVTAKTTLKVVDTLRTTLMKCYYNELKSLQKKLTFKGVDDIIKALRERLYAAMFEPIHYLHFEEIIQPLLEVRGMLSEKYHNLYADDVEQLIDKVKIFRTHFASLDIRQDHRKHKAAIQSIIEQYKLSNKPFEDLSENELIDILLNADCNAKAEDFNDPATVDALQIVSQLKLIQEKNGEKGCHRYIISNSEDIFSVLFVFALFRWTGWKMADISFDIVPLFETMIGMRNSEQVMRKLFSIPEYWAHIERREKIHHIMLGFSDGTKDGGYLKANYSIFQTKEKLTSVCQEFGVKALFFDGRGGPPARGGGKTQRFYAAQGDKIANHEIQLTIQGQTITSTFGTRDQFISNITQLISAGCQKVLKPDDRQDHMSDAQRKLIGELGELAFEKYNALKKHPRFISYLEEMSTLKFYGRAKIGSRPGKRGNTEELTLDDLRAISFVGSWSQLKQNVPGYFGIGTAIFQMKEAGRLDEVKTLFREAPFFKALMSNSMMSLKKCDFGLTSYMKQTEKYGEFWQILFDEYSLSKKMLLEISGYEVLMQEEPVSKMSIQIREKIVLPLLCIQQYALQKLAKEDVEHREVYEKIVTRSLYGNINASRNSA
jgi:phosphoenolpyruvate carboxylase